MAVVLALGAGLAACIVQIEIIQSQVIAIDSASSKLDATWPMDLSQEFQVVLHKDAIAVVRMEVITVTVGNVPEGNQARQLSGTLVARPAAGKAGSREFVLGTIAGLAVRTGAQAVFKYGLKVEPEDAAGTTLNEFMVEVLRGDGRYDLVLEGTADQGGGSLELLVEVDFQMGYET